MIDPALRIVTHLPLDELWMESGPVRAVRVRTVGEAEIAASLRKAPLRFVRADVGRSLEWTRVDERFSVWKEEVRGRVADPDAERHSLEERPDGWFCFASEWREEDDPAPIIVLERRH